MKIDGTFPSWIEKNKVVFGVQVPPVLKPPFAVLVKEGKTEVKPIVLCRECKWWTGIVCERLASFGLREPNFYCADGEKGEDNEK